MRPLRLLVALFFLLQTGCATFVKDPGLARERFPLTLGVPGALYHPGRAVGLVANVDVPTKGSETVVSGGRGEGAFSVSGNENVFELRKVGTREYSGRASILHFPSKNSFFFWGVTSRYGEARAGYAEHTVNFALAEPETTTVEWADRFATAGGTIGTSVITERDKQIFTSVFGLSGERQVYSRRTFYNDGSRGDVDPEQRAKTLAAYDDVRGRQLKFSYFFLTGFSF